MKIQSVSCWLVGGLLSQLLCSQEFVMRRDFLTDHEADVIRESQETTQRIRHYLHFARLRLEIVRQQLAKKTPGRSATIHRGLKEYGRIIETIDVVIDDALADEKAVDQIMGKIVSEEDQFLTSLQRFSDDLADDHFRYAFILEDAIEITQDSIELARQDLEKRLATILAADERAQREIEISMTPALREENTKMKAKEAKEKSKRPTLLKPSETLGPRTKKQHGLDSQR